MTTFTLTPEGPFDLAASARFLEGFAPAAHEGLTDGALRFAFPLEGDWRSVGVQVDQPSPARVRVRVHGDADPDRVRAQVARILSLDVDGGGFAAIGEADPVIGRLQARYPGLRPVTFWSPYEAAVWAVISHRVRMAQAAAIKQRLAERLGASVDVGDRQIAAFPAPARLLDLDKEPGLAAHKLPWLYGLAEAALDGRLDAAMLRALPVPEALARLRALPGIGPFSAELVLLRGAGAPDVFPTAERRLHATMAELYGLGPDPEIGNLEHLAEPWRPYRTWAAVLLRTYREDQT